MLTPDQVLADAEGLVADLVTDLDARKLTEEEGAKALASAGIVFSKASEIINVMLYGMNETKH